jgi:hypothetical protein
MLPARWGASVQRFARTEFCEQRRIAPLDGTSRALGRERAALRTPPGVPKRLAHRIL